MSAEIKKKRKKPRKAAVEKAKARKNGKAPKRTPEQMIKDHVLLIQQAQGTIQQSQSSIQTIAELQGWEAEDVNEILGFQFYIAVENEDGEEVAIEEETE